MTLRLSKNQEGLTVSPLRDPNHKGETSLEKPIREAKNLTEEETYHFSFFDLGQSKRAENEALGKALERMLKRGMDQLLGTERCY